MSIDDDRMIKRTRVILRDAILLLNEMADPAITVTQFAAKKKEFEELRAAAKLLLGDEK